MIILQLPQMLMGKKHLNWIEALFVCFGNRRSSFPSVPLRTCSNDLAWDISCKHSKLGFHLAESWPNSWYGTKAKKGAFNLSSNLQNCNFIESKPA